MAGEKLGLRARGEGSRREGQGDEVGEAHAV